MIDLLLDTATVVDVCLKRGTSFEESIQALDLCKANGHRVWLYAGSVQTLELLMTNELMSQHSAKNTPLSNEQAKQQARSRLNEFVKDKHWLAALADEGNVFDLDDVEHGQLFRALERFPTGSVKLLAVDENLGQRYPELTITPKRYVDLPLAVRAIPFIDLASQQDALRGSLELAMHRVMHHGQYIMGAEVAALERKLCAYTGSKHCITVASGTEALLISLMALGIGPGDEIITTPFTFIATAEVIVLLGAKPIFVDVEADTGNINAALIEAAITPKTKAIMPVSLYGQPADMDEINAIAAKHGNIPVIEDAAQSFGAEYKGRKSCNLSSIGCTSFFPSKPLGCYGDGGAIFTNDDAIALACKEIRVHGQSKRYVHTRIGVGGRMDTLQCAIVLAKMATFEKEVQQRIEIGARYNALMDAAGVRRIRQRDDRTSVYAQYTVLLDDREKVQEVLKKADIPTAVHYPVPLNEQPAYRHLCCSGCTPVSDQLAKQVMSLPMSSDLTAVDQDRIIGQFHLVNTK